jgi:hypothetical protein
MNFFYFLTLFISTTVFAQDAFIQKGDGSKIVINPSSVRIISNEKNILYKTLGSSSEQKIQYNNFETIFYNNFKFQCLKLTNKERDGYYVLSENKNNLLLSNIILKIDEENETQTISFQLFVVDKNSNAIIENFVVNDENNAKAIELRNKILPLANQYFSDCYDLLSRIKDYDKSNGDAKNLSVLGVFNSPIYYNYN